MINRRSFIRNTSLLTAGAFVTPSLFNNYKSNRIGLQLYTVRDAMQQDVAGTLAKVAQVGYNTVEGATYTGSQNFYGMTGKAFSALLKQNGLSMPSCHYRLGAETPNGQAQKGTILHEWDKAVDDARSAGVKYMVCAFLAPGERGGSSTYQTIAEQLNKAGEQCKKAGIQLCYHNHDFEFQSQDAKATLPYDILLNSTDKNLVKMEMDMYWVTKAGKDPIALIAAHPGRFPLWHLKDMDNTPQHAFTEVGNGTINFKNIMKHAGKAGLQYFFVEQDRTPGSPFDSIKSSFTYIKKNLV